MGSAEKSILFKDNIKKTESEYLRKITELRQAIVGGDAALKELLFGTESPELYAEHGAFRPGQHSACSGADSERETEKRVCRCLYYRNAIPDACRSDCRLLSAARRLCGDYFVTDYEIPAFYYGDHIGEIDLVITDGKNTWAAEVKPPHGNREPLLRMIAEIMTYTLGYGEIYQRAIAFFADSPQDLEYQKIVQSDGHPLQMLLQEAKITVFRFETEGNVYKLRAL